MNENTTSNKLRNGVILLVSFFIGALGMFALIKYYPVTITNNVVKTIKDVTVTENGIADAVEKVYDSVVTVETYKSKKLYSTGTGFVYKNENGKGYILTNHHVIESGDEIHVVFTNHESVKATVVGSDKYADIAVLSVESENILAVAEIGNSKEARIGDTVFAVGAPIDSSAYSWSVTRGILSGKDRLVEVSLNNSSVSDWVMSVLQTDAAINSGNSGGPLANSNGEVVGINSMKLASSSIEGMGFAIPIEMVTAVLDRLENNEKITRPLLGVSLADINNDYYLRRNNIYIDSSIKNGTVVFQVENNSTASEIGLKKGDVILKIDNIEIKNTTHFKYLLYKHQVGDKVKIEYFSDNETKAIEVTLNNGLND